MTIKPFRTYLRVCTRCGNLFNSTAKRGKVCDNCKIPTGKYPRLKKKKIKKD